MLIDGVTLLVAVLTVILALKRRIEIRHIKVPSSERSYKEDSSNWVLISRTGVKIDPEELRRLEVTAEKYGFKAADLVPANINANEIGELLRGSRLKRSSILKAGKTSGNAILLSSEIASKIDIFSECNLNAFDLNAIAVKIKKYAPRDFGFILSSSMTYNPLPFKTQKRIIEEETYPYAVIRKIGPVIEMTYFVSAVAISPIFGSISFGVFCLAPLISILYTRIHSRGLIKYSLFRIFYQLRWLTVTSDNDIQSRFVLTVDGEGLRNLYDSLNKNVCKSIATKDLTNCPICQSTSIKSFLISKDMIQRKPGEFKLSRCVDCKSVFQNPQLSYSALSYYYKDFYSGIWETIAEKIFSSSEAMYLSRAKMLKGIQEPTEWLDVGGGHGHFALVASQLYRDSSFYLLDLGDSVKDAEDYGWAKAAFDGNFESYSFKLANNFDTLSMFHYLEHSADPIVEMEAANRVLARNGILLIELPNPQCGFGRILRSYWLPWFQPQHLNLVSLNGLCKILESKGFEVIKTQPVVSSFTFDFSTSLILLFNRIVPPEFPWLQVQSRFKRNTRRVLGGLLCIGIVFPFCLDILSWLVTPRKFRSGAFRVIARKITNID